MFLKILWQITNLKLVDTNEMEGLVEVLESTSKKRFDPNKYFTKEEQEIVKETFSIFDEVRRMRFIRQRLKQNQIERFWPLWHNVKKLF